MPAHAPLRPRWEKLLRDTRDRLIERVKAATNIETAKTKVLTRIRTGRDEIRNYLHTKFFGWIIKRP